MLRRQFLLLLIPAVLMLASCDGSLRIGVKVDSKPTEEQVVQPDAKPPIEEDKPSREILFFTMRGCPPCDAAKPQVRAIRRQGVKITEIDCNSNPELVRKYNITRTPTFIVLENGVEVERTSSISVLIILLVKFLAIVLPLLLG